MYKKLILRMAICIVLAVAFIVVLSDIIVTVKANGRCYDNILEVPDNEYGLLLGTSPITPQGEHNYYFDNRIKATAELYHHGKIERIIASGGDYTKQGGYNELVAMRDSLMAYGVPDSVIRLDYTGTRTLNSVLQAKIGYDIDSITIVSQKYHNERALCLAEYHGIEAIAYNADTPPILEKRLKNGIREYFARVKMFIDLMLDSPKYD